MVKDEGEGTAKRPSPRVDSKMPNHPTIYLSIGGVVVTTLSELPFNQPKELPLRMFMRLLKLFHLSFLD
jgi:hypothetical protein